jgi:hypothetical protein
MGWSPQAASTVAILVLASMPRGARADSAEACMLAAEKAQNLRNAGKLSDAKGELSLCVRERCPALVRRDCTQWMGEVLAMLPTVVPGARDAKGRDLSR